MRICLAALLSLTALSAFAGPQVFVSKATSGSMDEFSRINYVRECSRLEDEPWISCSKQEITVKNKSGKIDGRFDDKQIPRKPDGKYKVNLAKVFVIDEDLGGGDGNRYFMLRFVPEDASEMDVTANGQMFPKYYEVITDMLLRPLPGMKVSASGAAAKWLDIKRKNSDQRVKRQEIERPLIVNEYLVIMGDR